MSLSRRQAAHLDSSVVRCRCGSWRILASPCSSCAALRAWEGRA